MRYGRATTARDSSISSARGPAIRFTRSPTGASVCVTISVKSYAIRTFNFRSDYTDPKDYHGKTCVRSRRRLRSEASAGQREMREEAEGQRGTHDPALSDQTHPQQLHDVQPD